MKLFSNISITSSHKGLEKKDEIIQNGFQLCEEFVCLFCILFYFFYVLKMQFQQLYISCLTYVRSGMNKVRYLCILPGEYLV